MAKRIQMQNSSLTRKFYFSVFTINLSARKVETVHLRDMPYKPTMNFLCSFWNYVHVSFSRCTVHFRVTFKEEKKRNFKGQPHQAMRFGHELSPLFIVYEQCDDNSVKSSNLLYKTVIISTTINLLDWMWCIHSTCAVAMHEHWTRCKYSHNH